MVWAVLLPKCLSVHSHMLTKLYLLRQRLVQCVVRCLLVTVLLIISRLYSTLKKLKRLIFEPTRKAGSPVNQKPVFTLEVMVIEIVNHSFHLGHIIVVIFHWYPDAIGVSIHRWGRTL